MKSPVAYLWGLLIILSLGSGKVLAQGGIQGEVVDRDGQPVPYAAIFIKELARGTTCNALGKFSLPLPPGTYTIFFRSLGYTEVSRQVELEEGYQQLSITLPPQTYMIPEVRVSASGEDPAYWIMRKTIGLANYHLNEVSRYEAEIYIKGTAILDKIPRALARRMEVNDVKVEEDEAYMMESMNLVEFNAPDKYTMKVLASQNTIPGYTDNVNPMDYVNASLYQDQIETVISPLARNAFSHYTYSWEGSFLEGTHMVNKIRVEPRRKSQQLVEGTLFIVDDLWCLHSSDLSVNTIAGTIRLQQLYANVMMDAWLPVSHKIEALIQIVGVKGTATYVSSLEYTDVSLNPNLPERYFQSTVTEEPAEEAAEKAPSKNEEKINELLQKEELTNREMARLSRLMEEETQGANEGEEGKNLDQTGTRFEVEEDAVKNDSAYWKEVRPIPLTPEEQTTLQERDSIIGSNALRSAAGDSTKTPAPRKGLWRDLAFGNTYAWKQGRIRLHHGGLLDLNRLGYNTVDGLYYGQYIRLIWRTDSTNFFRGYLRAGYAFHRNAPNVTWNHSYLYAPMRRGKVGIDLSYTSMDFNGNSGIPEGTNLMYTLFLRRNYLKLYEKREVIIYNRIDLVNGLEFNLSGSVGRRIALENNSLFSLTYRKAEEERFTNNQPPGRLPEAPELADQMRFVAEVKLQYTPEQYYVIRNRRKQYRQSDWPTLSVTYRQAIPLESEQWSSFSQLEASISQQRELGLLSEVDWSLRAGVFLDTSSVHFSDYRHFKASPLYVDMAGLDDALMFSDYYEASTKRYWAEAHARLSSSYLLIKYLPWFSERLWTESLDLAYLYTPEQPHYLQLGYSMNELFFMLDIGVYVGFAEDPEGRWGYRGITGRLNLRF